VDGLGHDVVRNLAGALGVPQEHLEALLYDRDPARPITPEPVLPFAVGVVAQANAGRAGGGYVEDFVYLPPSEARGRFLQVVRVTGDCMEPELSPGDHVLIDRRAVPQDGQIVVFTLDGGDVLIKRFHRGNGYLLLWSNGGDHLRLAPESVQIEGVVLRIMKVPERRAMPAVPAVPAGSLAS
jgi:phage repressor protein C with HTH and peptisase S24 domain